MHLDQLTLRYMDALLKNSFWHFKDHNSRMKQKKLTKVDNLIFFIFKLKLFIAFIFAFEDGQK